MQVERCLPTLVEGVARLLRLRPPRPRVVVRARERPRRVDRDLCHRRRALAVGGGDAVGAGIAAAEHDHVAAAGIDRVDDRSSGLAPVLAAQVVHGLMHPRQSATRYVEVARGLGADRQAHGVESGAQAGERDVAADLAAGAKLDAFAGKQVDAARELGLGELEVGNAVGHQATDHIVAFEHRDPVSGAIQLLGTGEPRRTAADHRDCLAAAREWRLRHDPALAPAHVDDRALEALDRHRFVVGRQHAGRLTRCRTGVAGELRKVVGRLQPFQRFPPAAAMHQIVPVRDQVADRAAGGAGGDATIHAAPALLAHSLRCPVRVVDRQVVRGADGGIAIADRRSPMLQETVRMVLAHRRTRACLRRPAVVPADAGGCRARSPAAPAGRPHRPSVRP